MKQEGNVSNAPLGELYGFKKCKRVVWMNLDLKESEAKENEK